MENEADIARNLDRTLAYVQSDVQYDWQLQQLRLFLKIARAGSRGITQTQLSEDLGMEQAVVSRNCLAMARRIKKGELVGHDIVQMRPDLHDVRRLNVTLSDKGRKVYGNMLALLEGKKGGK